MSQHPLLPCPFCGWELPVDDEHQMLDVLYPSGTWWADRPFYGKTYRTYRRHSEREPGDQQCWQINCTECMGGCGAQITADTKDEVIEKWNRRASA